MNKPSIDYKNLAVVKTIENLSDHLCKNKEFVLNNVDFKNKNYLYFFNVFNTFRESCFYAHNHIYVRMSLINYILNYRKCKRFNLKRITKKMNITSKSYSIFSEIINIKDKLYVEARNRGDLLICDFSNIIEDAYNEFYYERDKKYV